MRLRQYLQCRLPPETTMDNPNNSLPDEQATADTLIFPMADTLIFPIPFLSVSFLGLGLGLVLDC
ncbi:hypothetical protein DFH08DRAFT_971000 [Mycena albidolilacea]|uniref:Uncharacterized protein n=1 Tax=Mycena albidolilacea TaxID=1033008 RepID=A0AAD6ZF89_9AGAR|nr:hypothetical protein DFH08DRAFT_971000 [Mycena albidolilacea]